MEQEVKNQAQVQPQVQAPNPAPKGSGSLMHDFTTKDPSDMPVQKVIFSLLVVLFIGLLTGFGVSKLTGSSATGKSPLGKMVSQSQVQKGKTYGITDAETYKDTVEGKMVEGGVEGEGQYHLERPGGETQNVYLTSSTVDLSQFVGRKVKVAGQTQTAQKVGWLMDVGGVTVLD